MRLNEGQRRAVDRIAHDAYAGGGTHSPEADVRYLLYLINDLCSDESQDDAEATYGAEGDENASSSLREVAGFTDPEDIDELTPVTWHPVDEEADTW